MKVIRKLIISILSIITFLNLFSIKANAADNGYRIKSYNVNMVVNEDNTFNITETIVADFLESRHGIIRKIPLTNTVKRLDGTTSTNHARVTNVSVNNNYSKSTSDGVISLKIGDASRVITGEQKYVISYNYDIGKDPIKDSDELYYNIIGDQWDTTIENISFTVTMPKEFDKSKLGFSVGSYGSTENTGLSYNVTNNVISGEYVNSLRANQGLTIRLTLPEGYFVVVEKGAWINYLICAISAFCLLFTIYLWFKYGRDEKPIETIELYPPEGYNSLEVGFLYKGRARNKDVTSLLIYLANKGYIKISEYEKKSLLGKSKEFLITKLKEYDGNKEVERMFLNGLFLTGNEVTSADLYNVFYLTTQKILSKANAKQNRQKVFRKESLRNRWILNFMLIAVLVMSTIRPIIEYRPELMFLYMFVIPGLLVIANIPVMSTSKSVGGFITLWGIGFAGVPFLLLIINAIAEGGSYRIAGILGFISLIGILIFNYIITSRTKFGTEMLGKVKGFKTFLETAEKTKLEQLVEQNPMYFYNILPYTYVLGVSNKWMKKFEAINLQAPSWYDSTGEFSVMQFNSFMTRTMSVAQTAMTSNPSESSGGGSSGGGFSGGGSGGGGGSSW